MAYSESHGLESKIKKLIEEAIEREKRLKKWRRDWKLKLVQSLNPELKDLYDQVTDFD